MYLWCDSRCLFFYYAHLFFFWSEFPCQCPGCEIMSLRTYSCSSRKAKAKLFFKAKSTAVLQKGCKEVSHLVPVILSCSSVFRLRKKTLIPNFHFHRMERDTTWNIWVCFFRVISSGLFLLDFSPMRSKWNLLLNKVKEVTVAEFQLIGFISHTARC